MSKKKLKGDIVKIFLKNITAAQIKEAERHVHRYKKPKRLNNLIITNEGM